MKPTKITPKELEEYTRQENEFFSEGGANFGELRWSERTEQLPSTTPLGDEDDDRRTRQRMIQRVSWWLQVCANLAQIAAAAVAIFTLYVMLMR